MNDLVIAVFFVWMFQSVCTAVLFASHLKTQRNLKLRTEGIFNALDRLNNIEQALRKLKFVPDSHGNLSPYRNPAFMDSSSANPLAPVILPAHDPKTLNPSEWRPGMPCPFCLQEQDPEDPTESACRPSCGAGVEAPFITWRCVYCESEWRTGIQGQDGLQRDGKVREHDVISFPRPVGPRRVSD